jgi:hypothetical protein
MLCQQLVRVISKLKGADNMAEAGFAVRYNAED